MAVVTRLIPTVGACMLMCVLPVRAQGTFFLKPYSVENSLFEGLMEQQARWLVKVDKPDEIKGLPADLGRRVYYYTGEVGGRKLLALVVSGRDRRLYVDLDGDQDLSDERPVTPKRVRSPFNFGWSRSYRFGPLAFPVPESGPAGGDRENRASSTESDRAALKTATGGSEGRGAPTGSNIFFAEQFDLDYLLIRPAVCRRGVVRIGRRSFSVFLTDGNYNNRYDDVFKFPLNKKSVSPSSTDSDFISLDLNRNGQLEFDSYRLSETQPLTRLVQLQGDYYSVRVTPDGTALTLETATPQMGTLDIKPQEAELVVTSENGMFLLIGTGGKFQVPAGPYRLCYVTLRARDDKKFEWMLRGRVPDKAAVEFKIEPNRTTPLKLGPPLKMEAWQRSHRTLLSGRVVSFGAMCRDELGVEYEAGAVRGRTRGPAPSVKLYDESGKLLSSGRFEYG